MLEYCDSYITAVFFWWFSHVIVGSQRIFLVLTIVSTFFMNIDNLNDKNIYSEKSHHNKTTTHGMFQCDSIVSNYERRNSSDIILYRGIKSPMGYSLYYDKNEDGHWDKIELHKTYAGIFRFPDPEFDRYFADRWRYGTLVKLEDREGDDCFKKKTLSEIRRSREDVWTTVFTDKNCDGIYELQEERNVGWPPDSLYDRIWIFGREIIMNPTTCM